MSRFSITLFFIHLQVSYESQVYTKSSFQCPCGCQLIVYKYDSTYGYEFTHKYNKDYNIHKQCSNDKLTSHSCIKLTRCLAVPNDLAYSYTDRAHFYFIAFGKGKGNLPKEITSRKIFPPPPLIHFFDLR